MEEANFELGVCRCKWARKCSNMGCGREIAVNELCIEARTPNVTLLQKKSYFRHVKCASLHMVDEVGKVENLKKFNQLDDEGVEELRTHWSELAASAKKLHEFKTPPHVVPKVKRTGKKRQALRDTSNMEAERLTFDLSNVTTNKPKKKKQRLTVVREETENTSDIENISKVKKRKARSAYAFFAAETTAKLVQNKQNVSDYGELKAVIAKQWKKLAKEKKVKFEKMALYDAEQVKNMLDSNEMAPPFQL